MSDENTRTLNYFALVRFTDAHAALDSQARKTAHDSWLEGLRSAARGVDVYQNTGSQADLLLWCALEADDPAAPGAFFEKLTCATAPYRALFQQVSSLWGFTRPSQYTKTRSAQEIDPFAEARKRYLVMYPFTKTPAWYLMSREARQGMMNEHIRIGKQYEQIQQLLLYSFGLQDQEFVVVYETDNLVQFSDLVNELRNTEARRYTLQDAPVHTAVYHPARQTLALWE